MKKKILKPILMLFIFLLLETLVVSASGEKVIFNPGWEEGDCKEYLLVKTTRKNNILVRELETNFSLKIIEARKTGFIFEWEKKEVRVKKPQGLEDSFFELFTGVNYRYSTDSRGIIQNLLNLKKVKESLAQAGEILANNIKDGEEREVFRKILASILGSNQQIKLLLTRDLQLFHNPYILNRVFENNQLYQGEVMLPNPWGMESFTGIIKLIAHKDAEGFNIIEINQELDKEKSARLLKEIVKELGKAGDVNFNLPENEILNSVEIKDTFIYTFREGASWFEEIELTRRVKLGEEVRVDKTLINSLP